ncbi:MAG: ABC transporter permease [Chloroflexi bacterium]|nr:ABC transporter permease [Chloroflexota bacterium]
MAVAEKTQLEPDFALRKERSPWGDAFQQLLKHKVAVGSGIFIILLILAALFADVVAPFPYAKASFMDNYAPAGSVTRLEAAEFAGKRYWLGADYLGRDILSRTIFGAQVSLAVGFVGSGVSMIIGMVYGLISGYASTRVDNIMMRFVDFLYALPLIIFVILLQVFFKAQARHVVHGATSFWTPFVEIDQKMGGMFFLFVALGMLNWLGMARITRGQVLSLKEKEFVEAARMVGASNMRIVFKHLLPNVLGPCIVAETLAIPGYIFTEAFLSFIGLGIDAPRPSWGNMISESYAGLYAVRGKPLGQLLLDAHLLSVFVPSVALTITVLAFNFLGDGLRDAFDPRLRE